MRGSIKTKQRLSHQRIVLRDPILNMSEGCQSLQVVSIGGIHIHHIIIILYNIIP